jgi:hypothetical protein
MIDLTLFSAIIKDECMVLMVGTNMEGEDAILAQSKSITILAITALSSFTALQDVRLDVKEEVVDVT